MLSDENKILLIRLARLAIEKTFLNESVDSDLIYEFVDKIPKELDTKKGCFVTLKLNNQLRGCIGTIEPVFKMYECTIRNAVNAAFRDYRFDPLMPEEYDKIKIEISVLSKPIEIDYKNPDDLLNKIKSFKDGIILEKDNRSATFLPQVWEQIPNKIEFLEQLSLKAGLNHDIWKTAEISKYTVESFEED